MATVSAVITTVSTAYPTGTPCPVPDAAVVSSEAITSSGTAAQGSNAVPTYTIGGQSMIWVITTPSPVWAAFGSNPTAASGTSYYVPANVPMAFGAVAGQKVSVIDA